MSWSDASSVVSDIETDVAEQCERCEDSSADEAVDLDGEATGVAERKPLGSNVVFNNGYFTLTGDPLIQQRHHVCPQEALRCRGVGGSRTIKTVYNRWPVCL